MDRSLFKTLFESFGKSNDYGGYNITNNTHNNEIWTMEKLKDELYVHLMTVETNGERKYAKQARDLIYRIPIHRPTPAFIISNGDLSSKLITELSGLDHADLDVVIRDVISGIYESIDKNYFLLSIKKHGLLLWRIEP